MQERLRLLRKPPMGWALLKVLPGDQPETAPTTIPRLVYVGKSFFVYFVVDCLSIDFILSCVLYSCHILILNSVEHLGEDAQAVKSILQGSSSRTHQQRPPKPPPSFADSHNESATATTSSSPSTRNNEVAKGREEPKKAGESGGTPKKRSLLEVLKNPSNAKVPDKTASPQAHRHHHDQPRQLDKSEIEYLEALKVNFCFLRYSLMRI